MGQPVVQLSSVSKSFGDLKAVDDISFEIHRGEFFSILGPSGCGKTTLLNLVARSAPSSSLAEVRANTAPLQSFFLYSTKDGDVRRAGGFLEIK